MALTVFAENMGFFHKGSGGFGVAPLDVCLSPPPGPVPIPYTNVLFAKDLIKGSKTVRIDGEPTFLEDYSETSTSIGDEGGTLGGSVITGVILGKGYFMVWSMTVQIEGMGVCRHGDMMGQNSASTPPSSIDAAGVNNTIVVTAPRPGSVAYREAILREVDDATGPGDSEPWEEPPCTFDKIAIECAHVSDRGVWEYTFDGQIRDNLPRTAGKPFNPNLQGVGGVSGNEPEVFKIKITGGPGYTCDRRHPTIVITNRSTSEVVTHEGKTEVELTTACEPIPIPAHAQMSPLAIIGHYWFPAGAITRYIVSVDSCGITADQEYGFERLSRQIEVFPHDKYKLSITVPAARQRTYKREGEGPLALPIFDHIPPTTPVAPGESRWSRETAYTKDLPEGSVYSNLSPADRAIVETVSTVKLTRNGGELEASVSLGKMVRAIAELENTVQSVVNFIQDIQPKIGWHFSFAIAAWAGKLELEWGWKESDRHVVFPWWKIKAAMSLLEVSLEVDFGIDFRVFPLVSLELVLYGKVEGKISFEVDTEATVDEQAYGLRFPGSISGELGLRVGLGSDWVTAQGSVEAKIVGSVTPEIHPQNGFGLNWEAKFDGIAGVLTGTVAGVGSYNREVVWCEPRELGSGRFPAAATLPTGVPAPGGQVTSGGGGWW